MRRKQLERICKAGIPSFAKLGDTIDTANGPLTHIDNGTKILGVGHLDWVMRSEPTIKGDTIRCPQLDDRLGVWTLLELLPKLGCVPFDILLTDSEESANSTAQHFVSPKEYNWIFEFDRAGKDVVMYEYLDDDSEALLDSHGFTVGMGSFTDICYLSHLERKGFNFGVGYHGQHSDKCYADLKDTESMARQFCRFATEMADIQLPHVPKPAGFDWWHAGDDEEGLCPSCTALLEPYFNYCPECGLALYHDHTPHDVLYEDGSVLGDWGRA